MVKKPKILLSQKEFRIFKKLDSPVKVQDFLNNIPMNFKKTCRSPLMVLQENKAYCLEGAFLAAAIFWYHGNRPLIFYLKTIEPDYDHVLALFREGNNWGAVSKTNYPVLRYREPVYKNIRELAMSYFNEYFLDSGKKTMRGYSKPLDLRRFGEEWLTSKKNIWHIDDALLKSKYYTILDKGMVRRLRKADSIEIQAAKAREWKLTNKR